MKKELVRNWMTQDVITVKPETPLPEAHQIMMDEEIRRLPVVDDEGILIGIVTLGDVRGAQPSPATSLSIWELNYLLSSLTIGKIMTPKPMTITARCYHWRGRPHHAGTSSERLARCRKRRQAGRHHH